MNQFELSFLNDVPDNVLTDFALVRLPSHALGCTGMTSAKLRRCTDDAILQVARRLRLRRRQGESLGSVLFAIRVMVGPVGLGDPPRSLRFDCQNDGEYEVFTCGDGNFGRLGHGDSEQKSSPQRVEALIGKKVVQAFAGMSHTAVLTVDGGLFTFGLGAYGALGHGTTEDQYTPKRVETLVGRRVTSVSIGTHYTAVLTDSGEVLTCGRGMHFVLGHGNCSDSHVFKVVEGALIGKRVVRVKTAEFFMLALTSEGDIFTWGGMVYGRLGSIVHCGVTGRWHSHSSVTKGIDPAPRMVDLPRGMRRIVHIATGVDHSAMLTTNGEVLTMGCGERGQLGHGSIKNCLMPRKVKALQGKRVVHMKAGAYHMAVIVEGGEVLTWGTGAHGRLGHSSERCELLPRRIKALENDNVTQLSAGLIHTAALTADGRLFTFGDAYNGKLGHSVNPHGHNKEPRLVSTFEGRSVASVSCGFGHTVMIVSSDLVSVI